MRRILIQALLFGAIFVVSSSAALAQLPCGNATFLGHLESFIECADFQDSASGNRTARDVTASAWMLANPGQFHSNNTKMACEVAGEGSCNPFLGSGTDTDGNITVESDWSLSTFIGCPVGQPNPRIAIHVQGFDGRQVLLSVFQDQLAGFTADYAHPVTPEGSPIAIRCDDAMGKTRLTSLTSDGLNATLELMFSRPAIYTDCDPQSYGKYLDDNFGAGSCRDNFVPQVGFGQVYWSHQPCSDRVQTVIGRPAPAPAWNNTLVTPDAAGQAIVNLIPIPQTAGTCLYVGTQTALNTTTGGQPTSLSSGITGFVRVAGQGAASDRALDVRATRAQGKVTVTFRTGSELEAVSFDLVADGRVVTSNPVAAKGGNGIGAPYEIVLKMGDLKGAKSVAVRTNLRSGGSITSDAVSF